MSERQPFQAILVAALATAAAILGLAIVSQAAVGLPLHARLLAGTWIGVGGVTAVVYRAIGARPLLGDLRSATLVRSALAGVALSVFGAGALLLERAMLPFLEPVFAAKEAFAVELLKGNDPLYLPLVVFVAAVSPALCEEVLFRGVLQRYLGRYVGVTTRVLALGLLFSLMHLDPTVLLPMTFIGAMLCVIGERTGGWGAAAVAHFSLNAFSVVVMARVAEEPSVWVGGAMVALGATLAGFALAGIESRERG